MPLKRTAAEGKSAAHSHNAGEASMSCREYTSFLRPEFLCDNKGRGKLC
jgi:hypothetical protein